MVVVVVVGGTVVVTVGLAGLVVGVFGGNVVATAAKVVAVAMTSAVSCGFDSSDDGAFAIVAVP